MWSYSDNSTHKVDDKGRVSVPSDIRKAVEALNGGIKAIRVTRSAQYPCLEAHDLADLAEVSAELKNRERTRTLTPEDQRERNRLFRMARHVEIDSAGRIVLPKDYMAAVGIAEECVFVGCGHYFEIWQPAAYAAHAATFADDLPSLGG
ncbi:MAG: division/cell wall cluster transcriptional repressor MraZ [Pseudomonadota bacterium]